MRKIISCLLVAVLLSCSKEKQDTACYDCTLYHLIYTKDTVICATQEPTIEDFGQYMQSIKCTQR